MAEKITLTDLNKTLSEMNVQSLEGIKIEGDVEIEIDAGAGGVGPLFAYYFGQEAAQIAMQLIKFAKAVGYPVDALMQPVAVAQAIAPAPKELAAAAAAVPAFKVASALASAKFSCWHGQDLEVPHSRGYHWCH